MAFQSSLSSVLLMSSLLGDSFLVTKLFRLPVYCVRCLPLLLVPQILPVCHSIFAFLVHQLSLYAQKIVVALFWWFWVGMFCIRPFPLLLRLTSFQSMIFSIFFWCTFLLLQVFFLGLLSVSSIHFHTEGWTICFQSVDFDVNSDISVGEDGLHFGECVFRQCYSNSEIWLIKFDS